MDGSGDLRAIQDLLGHASISTTQRYIDIDEAGLMAVYDRAHARGRLVALILGKFDIRRYQRFF